MARSVISGSSGFIGSALARELAKQGQEVYPVPRELLYKPRKLKDYLAEKQPDYIFHLAAYGNHYTQKNLKKTFRANVEGTWNLLYATKDLPYIAFCNISTSSVTLPRQTPYSLTKAAGENLAVTFSLGGKRVVNVRPYSVYGEGEAEFRFIPKISRRISVGKQIELSPGTHDWIHVSDFVSGLITIAKNAQHLSGMAVSVGTGVSTSNLDVAAMIQQIAGKIVPVKAIAAREYDAKNWVADPRLLRYFGWTPKVTLYEGLKRCYEYYK